MEEFGVEFLSKDLPLAIDAPKRRGCGKKGKWWYWLRRSCLDAGGCFIVGRFGSYKSGESRKVEIDWKPLAEPNAPACALSVRPHRPGPMPPALLNPNWPRWVLLIRRRAAKEGASPTWCARGSRARPASATPWMARWWCRCCVTTCREQALRAVQRIKPGWLQAVHQGVCQAGLRSAPLARS